MSTSFTEFTEDDVGKTVEESNGTAVGIVAAVDDETALVELDPDAVDSIKAALGWEADAAEPVSIAPADVDVITGETVRLDRDVDAGEQRTGGSATAGGDEPTEIDRPQVEGEAGGERHADNEDAPPEGNRTVTEDRGRKDDR